MPTYVVYYQAFWQGDQVRSTPFLLPPTLLNIFALLGTGYFRLSVNFYDHSEATYVEKIEFPNVTSIILTYTQWKFWNSPFPISSLRASQSHANFGSSAVYFLISEYIIWPDDSRVNYRIHWRQGVTREHEILVQRRLVHDFHLLLQVLGKWVLLI